MDRKQHGQRAAYPTGLISRLTSLEMSHLQEKRVGRPSNKYAILLGILNVACSALVCYSLLMIRYGFIKNPDIYGKWIFPTRFLIPISVIAIVVGAFIGLCVIVKFRYRKRILNIILAVMIGFFFILNSIIALTLNILW